MKGPPSNNILPVNMMNNIAHRKIKSSVMSQWQPKPQ